VSSRAGLFLGDPGPIALAHRGGAKEAVENSPAAFQRAVDLGFGFIETDVRATRDGHAVVVHDATLDRTADLGGAVAALPLVHVQRTVLADGASPITLLEALRRWPAVRFNVDVKDDHAIAPFLAAVDAADAWHRVCAAAFSTARLRRLRALAGPRLATSMGPTEVGRLVVGVPDRSPAGAAQVPRSSGRIPVVTRRFVRRAHARGLQVHVWTIDEPSAMEQLLDLGVDGIVTDRPSVLRSVLEQRGTWR
jgi:glycerophosphoryl diester phosphodiesterase